MESREQCRSRARKSICYLHGRTEKSELGNNKNSPAWALECAKQFCLPRILEHRIEEDTQSDEL